MMRWLILAVGILMEVGAATSMKLAEGFTRLIPSILTFVSWVLGLAAFVLALERFDLSFAYAIWAGMGILAVIAVGGVGLNLSDMLSR